MSQVFACPSCRQPLNIRPELLGRPVRCPSCQTVFATTAPPPPAPPSEPVVPELSLDDDAAATLALPQGKMWGAVELSASSSGPPPPLPPPVLPDPEPPRQRPRARLSDEEGLIRCPECNARLPAGSPRCVRCGARPDDDVRSERRHRRGEVEPHRGAAVLTLGILSLVFSFCAPIGLTLGIIAWVMGQGDLAKMRRREMDREGQGPTTGGWICGMIGVVLSVILGLFFLVIFLARIDDDDRRQPFIFPPNPGVPGRRF